VAVTHGAVGDPRQYVRTRTQALNQLAVLEREFAESELLILGHTHVAHAVGERRGELLRGGTGTIRLEAGERHVLNPGSVGQSRDRRVQARALVLDLERRAATFHALAFDALACRAALRRGGRPAWSCHLSPSRAARARRWVARTLGRW
jgi:predicted phosphodiesterase